MRRPNAAGLHAKRPDRRDGTVHAATTRRWLAPAILLLILLAVIGGWALDDMMHRMSADDIAQTGSYKTEADSLKPLAVDRPDGVCWSDERDAQVRRRISDVIYAHGADPDVVREWDITAETAARAAQ